MWVNEGVSDLGKAHTMAQGTEPFGGLWEVAKGGWRKNIWHWWSVCVHGVCVCA